MWCTQCVSVPHAPLRRAPSRYGALSGTQCVGSEGCCVSAISTQNTPFALRTEVADAKARYHDTCRTSHQLAIQWLRAISDSHTGHNVPPRARCRECWRRLCRCSCPAGPHPSRTSCSRRHWISAATSQQSDAVSERGCALCCAVLRCRACTAISHPSQPQSAYMPVHLSVTHAR
jgi:hypothetical protein